MCFFSGGGGCSVVTRPTREYLVICGDDHSGQGLESLGVYNLRANFVVVHVHLQRQGANFVVVHVHLQMHGASVFAFSFEDCHNLVAFYDKQRILRTYSCRIPTGGFTKENKNIGKCY